MAVKIPFKNPQTDEIRTVKVGWSWTLFFFTNFFGVPYFIRRLPRWGFLFLATSIIGNVFQVALGAQPILLLLSAGYLAIAIGMGLKGNEITAKAYLEKGWALPTRIPRLLHLRKINGISPSRLRRLHNAKPPEMALRRDWHWLRRTRCDIL